MTNKSVMTFISVNKISVCLSVCYITKGASLMFEMFQNTGTVLIGFGHPLAPLMQKDETNRRNLVAITFHF